MNASRTLEQLEATSWPEPEQDAPPHVHRCHALRRVPIERLTAGELRALIAQDIGLKYLMPRALGHLKHNPLLEAEYYPGDLLCAAVGVGLDYWSTAKSELATTRGLAQKALELMSTDPIPTQYRQQTRDLKRFLGESAA